MAASAPAGYRPPSSVRQRGLRRFTAATAGIVIASAAATGAIVAVLPGSATHAGASTSSAGRSPNAQHGGHGGGGGLSGGGSSGGGSQGRVSAPSGSGGTHATSGGS